jgi:hypothetical protein
MLKFDCHLLIHVTCNPVRFPVPKGTPMISLLVDWDHSVAWDVPKAEDFDIRLSQSHGGATYETFMNMCVFCFPFLQTKGNSCLW